VQNERAAVTDSPSVRLGHLADLATPFALRAVASLRVPDLIDSGVCELDALAAATGADCGALGRVLRYLAHRDVFVEPEPGVFSLTAIGRLLREDDEDGRRGRLDLASLGARMDLAFSGLLHSVKTGEAAYGTVHGRPFWADLDAHPELGDSFDALMADQQHHTAPQVAAIYDWTAVQHVVDIGGGDGGLLTELLSSHPHLRGTLVDRPGPGAAAAARLAEASLTERADVVTGDFFGPLPAGRDVYIVSRVLSDWSDRHVIRILGRMRDAASPAGRVLIVEMLPNEPHVPHLSSFDLKMLVVVGGKERTVADFAELAAAAGLSVSSVQRGKHGLVIIGCAGQEAGSGSG
jgi:2,7-dihydroxy-5-methyl-1-naphthoate 7-O-methyltransferase